MMPTFARCGLALLAAVISVPFGTALFACYSDCRDAQCWRTQNNDEVWNVIDDPACNAFYRYTTNINTTTDGASAPMTVEEYGTASNPCTPTDTHAMSGAPCSDPMESYTHKTCWDGCKSNMSSQ
ncbi:MAG: hypothetical protein HYS13_09280 [Planctomycetia bacterium]|nr:hypothetical protein [Planctomycetia bacterium]